MLLTLINQNTPENILRYININSDTTKAIISAIEAKWVAGNKSCSTPFYADNYGHKELGRILFGLSQAGWINSIAVARQKWGEFSLNQSKLNEYMNHNDQIEYRRKLRVAKYALRHTDCYREDLVKTPSGIKPTGLVRPGFAKSANMSFKFDVVYIRKYYDTLQVNLVKSIEKMAKKYPQIKDDEANYGEIAKDLLDYYMFNDGTYNMEGNTSDQRGRAIFNALKRVFNPIASKDARSLLVATSDGKHGPVYISNDDTRAKTDIYLFIAELIGAKSSSWQAKKVAGVMAYKRRELHNLDLTLADDRKELHENIWLERIYAALDKLELDGSIIWDIPLEMDQTMSLGQIVGVLMNDARLLDKTNVVNETTLLDAWHIDGVPRLHTKTVGTPTLTNDRKA